MRVPFLKPDIEADMFRHVAISGLKDDDDRHVGAELSLQRPQTAGNALKQDPERKTSPGHSEAGGGF